ncbi:MAG: type IV secretory system conjugative DNA transfer family protein [Ignavibacteriaceae bacterium]
MDKYLLKLGWLETLDYDLPYIADVKKRFNHFYIIGKSGMGKSVLMERMADYDMKYGLSVIFIDPKGDSVNKLTGNSNYRYISFNHPIKINPLRRKGYKVDTLIREFTDVMDIMITATSINPEATVRMKEILAKAIKGFKEEDRSLKFLNEFLSFRDVRKSYNFSDPLTRKWFNEIEDTTKSGYKKSSDYINTMSSIASRLSQFLDNDEMSQFLTTGENEFDIADFIDKGRSLLVNTNTSDNDNQRFLSALILYSVFSYIKDEKIKKPLMIYIDEFQTSVNSSFPSLLQFARSCQVGFTLSHHDFLEINPKVLSSIFGIVGSYIVFNCGDTEAERLSATVRASKANIMDLKDYTAYVRMGTDNSFIKTFPPLQNEFIPPPQTIPTEPVYNFLSNDWIML